MYKVLMTDNVADAALAVFDGFDGVEATRVGTLAKEELVKVLPEYDAVIVRSPTKLTADVIVAGEKLKYIGRAGVGVDNIDVDAATKQGITVMNSPGGNTISTAEHTVAMILALARRIPQADRSLREGRWDRKAFKGIELNGKTLGVIGIGRVGREVARRMLGFGMEVLAVDPFVSNEAAAEMGVSLTDMESLVAKSHVITVHVPLGADTRAIIGAAEIARMRDGVLIVNCARGGVVDERAVVEGLESGKIGGAAFDVFAEEPPGSHALFSNDRTVVTPHLGASTTEAGVRVAVEVAEKVAVALTTGEVRDAVNRPKG